MHEIHPDFAEIPLLASLSRSTREQLAALLLRRDSGAGEVLFLEGEPCAGVYFISRGEARIFHLSADGREQVLARLGPGSVFNSVPPLLAEPRNQACARTPVPSILYLLPTRGYLDLLERCPDFSTAVLHDFAGRLAQLTGLVERLSLHSVRGRLAQFLLDQADGPTGSRWTQDEIAEQLGTVRDVVGRTLRAFIEAGYIRKERQKIAIVNRQKLEEEART